MYKLYLPIYVHIYLQKFFYFRYGYKNRIKAMFVLDLKSLMQLAKSTDVPMLMHKRVRCGKVR